MNTISTKIKVGILGATGMVGQRFITLLENHPWFEVTCVAASRNSAGKQYEDAVQGRWNMKKTIPESVKTLTVYSVEDDINTIQQQVDFVFSAIEADKESIRRIEEAYAAAGVPVVSNNSAHRWSEDVPMIMPEINPHHLAMIPIQQEKRNWKNGFIVVKPNCSIQSYVPIIRALEKFKPEHVMVTTLQAISGAGKTFDTFPEITDNVIPFIKGEDEKSEREPLKILGTIEGNRFRNTTTLSISATCTRIPVSDGHLASVSIKLREKASRENIIEAITAFSNPLDDLDLPSAPQPIMTYLEDDNRPQTRLDRDFENGMGISVGRLRVDPVLDWRMVALSHNTIRGAAGGAVLVAELLYKNEYFR